MIFYSLYQTRGMANTQYLEKFQTCVSIVDQHGGPIIEDTGPYKAELAIILNEVEIADPALVTLVENKTVVTLAKDK
jgi:hypothetical protein